MMNICIIACLKLYWLINIKQMRKLLIILAPVFFYFASCKKSNDPPTPAPQIQLKADSTTLNLSGNVGMKDSFNIQSNGSWTIAINPSTASWLKPNVTNGTGNAKVYVDVQENNMSGVNRSSTLIITADGSNVTPINIAVTQKQYLTLITKIWSNVFGGTENDFFNSAIQTPDGGYLAVGTQNSNNGDASAGHGGRDIWVIKLDANGNKVWEKSYGGSTTEDGASMTKTTDGNYVIAGNSDSNDGDANGNHGYNDILVFKIDGSGNKLWQKMLGGSSFEFTANLNSITSSADGGSVLAIETKSNDGDVSGNHGDFDVWLVKLSQDGTIVWKTILGGSFDDTPNSIISSSDGGYVIAGETISIDGDVTGNHGSYDAWVVKIDGNGNKVWQKTFGGSSIDDAFAITRTSDNGYIVGGYTVSNDGDVTQNKGGSDAWIIKIDANGNKMWQKTFGGSGNDAASSILQTDLGYLISAQTNSNNGDVTSTLGGDDAWIFQVDENGTMLRQKAFGGTQGDAGITIFPTSDASYIMVGSTASTDGDIVGQHGKIDAWIMKFKDR
jgi:Putative binding domain, N-terminal